MAVCLLFVVACTPSRHAPTDTGSADNAASTRPAGILSSATASAPSRAPAVRVDRGVTKLVPSRHPGDLGYLVRFPEGSVPAGVRYPTIIFLHGLGERGAGTHADLVRLTDTGLPQLAFTHRLPTPAQQFMILAPQTDDQSWSAAKIQTWLTRMRRQYPIDPQRIYLTGISMGGGGVVRYLDTYGPRTPVAAAAPISGDWTPPRPVTGVPSCGHLGTTPLWAFAGDIDDVVPHQFSINLISYLNKHCVLAEPDRLTLYQGRFHDVWTHTYDLHGMTDKIRQPWQPYDPDLYTWFLQHHR